MKIVVLTGGISTERDVSLSSGAEICKALRKNGHEVLLLDVFMGIKLPEGGIGAAFHLPDSNLSIAEDIKVDVPDIEAIKASREDQSASFFGPNVISICQVADICFLGLHGGYGENGRLQAALDLLGIRYTGPSSFGNALAMDKGITKHIFAQNGIPTPKGVTIEKGHGDYSLQALGLSLPLVIKPSVGGSSIGVYIAHTEEEYEEAIEKSFAFEDALIIESYIKGREFACGFLGKKALPVIEIIPKSGFFDYANKYQSGCSEEICPADLPIEITKQIQSLTEKAMSALQLNVYSRADFLVDADNHVFCLEMNTLPGMTPSSLLPKEALAAGISYNELCEKIIDISINTKYVERTYNMEPITLEQIRDICHGTYMGDAAQLKEAIRGVKIDSRKIVAEDLFVPMKGERVDGHDFIPDVMKKKATCTLSEKTLDYADFPYIIVESCEQALQDLAIYYRDSLDITVIGITGSVGKTSTKEMIASVLEEKYAVLKTEGNFNNLIGLPLTIFQINSSHQVAVLEMGVNLFGEMDKLAKIAKPNKFVLTNIGVAHIESLGSREGILKAKTESFAHLKPNSQILLNGDDDMLCTMTQVPGHTPVFYGLSKPFPAHATDIESLGLNGTACVLHIEDSDIPVTIPLPGTHHVSNALAAAYLGKSMGLSDAQIKQGIESVKAISGRSNIIDCGNYTILDDCYNANPVSMRSALDVLANGTGRRVAILGDMRELGPDEIPLHREIGHYVATKGIEVIICIGALSKYMAEGAKEKTVPPQQVLYYETKEEALEELPNIINDGDTVLLKASNGMKFSKLLKFLTTYKE